MTPFILAAALALATQFGAKTSENHVDTDVGGDADEDTLIALPTDKYRCTRLPVSHNENTLSVMVGCTDKNNNPLFVLGALCRTDVPDSDLAVIVLNVNEPGQKPRPVQIALTCRSFHNGTSL